LEDFMVSHPGMSAGMELPPSAAIDIRIGHFPVRLLADNPLKGTASEQEREQFPSNSISVS
jgi:hypothetical protein